MSDQCKSCTAKGDAKKCESLECNLHETWIVERLKKEIKDLKTWEGLMKILDDAYPESIFTTELFDNDKRDAGVRIISLLRIVDRLERQINETHDARDLLLEDALKEVDRQRKIIETKENQDISDEARIAYINDPVFRHIVDRISEYMRSENFGASKFHEAINLAKEVNEHMLSRQI